MKKVLLYLASNSPFYRNLYPSIRRGFEEAGCLVEGGANLLESKELIEKIESFKPDFVFEMNRVKSEIQDFPEGVIHICWLVDFWGRLHENLKGSDILYVWSDSWIEHFELVGVKNVFYLPPATDRKIYNNKKTVKNIDFLFLGHISKEWTSFELERKVGLDGDREICFFELLPKVKKNILGINGRKPFLESLEKDGIKLYKPIDKSLLYDISSRSFRQIRREHYLDIFLKLNRSMEIYGSEHWKLYKRFSGFYKGYIENPFELNRAIRGSRVLLQDGYDPHFRTFDSMLSGTVVAAAKANGVKKDPWSLLGFVENEDYLGVNIYTEKLNLDALDSANKLNEIAKNAYQKVLQNHLWVHRAEKILKDINNLKGSSSEQVKV